MHFVARTPDFGFHFTDSLVPAKGKASVRAGLQVSEHHEKFGEALRHRGAAQSGERGRHGGRRERDQAGHQRISLRAHRDTEELRHEYVHRGEQRDG